MWSHGGWAASTSGGLHRHAAQATVREPHWIGSRTGSWSSPCLAECSAGRRPGVRILQDLPEPGEGGCQLALAELQNEPVLSGALREPGLRIATPPRPPGERGGVGVRGASEPLDDGLGGLDQIPSVVGV